MMSGNGWSELFIQGPITKETKKLGVVEELTAKILEPKYCVVTDNGLSYPMYDNWITCNFDEYQDNFIYNHGIGDIKPDRLYRIIGKAPHIDRGKIMLYLIQDMDTEQVFIIEEEGIEKCNDILVSAKDTITVQCDKLDTSIISNYIEREERIMNNKIVDLYYERKKKELLDKYEKLIKEEYEALDVVKEYNELVDTFNTSLAEMANRYNSEEVRVLIKTGYKNTYEYELSFDLKDTIKDKHREEYNTESKKLELLVEEVRAMLAFSDSEEHRLNVLKQYEIIDKKGKLNA